MNSTSYFGEEREIKTKSLRPIDFSKICFVFPAQSSAHEGMFEELMQNPIMNELFRIADEFSVGKGIGKISDFVNNPENVMKDKQHIIKNLCLCVIEVGLFRIFEKQGMKPCVLLSHSFGEYPLLVSSGVISFEDMLQILLFREEACGEPHKKGYLISVGLDSKKLEAELNGYKYEIANYNSRAQTVIGVSSETLALEIKETLKEKNILCKILFDVPHPYHTTLMAQARSTFKAKLEKFDFKITKPTYDFYSCVANTLIAKDNFSQEIIQEILYNQLTHQVNFIESVSAIFESEIYSFLEVGPKRIFSTLIEENIQSDLLNVLLLENYLQKSAQPTQKKIVISDEKLLSRIVQTISKITGYAIDKIDINMNFQEDLGIDSIKKADILFTILYDEGIESQYALVSSDIKSVGDLVVAIEKSKKAKESATVTKRTPKFKRYVVEYRQEDLHPIGNYTFNIHNIVEIKLSDVLRNITDISFFSFSENPIFIVHIDVPDATYEQIAIFIGNMQKIINSIEGEYGIILAEKNRGILFDAFAAFFKSLYREDSNFGLFKAIEYSTENLHDLVALERGDKVCNVVYYQNGDRFIPDFKEQSVTGEVDLTGKTILIIGGTKGIGQSLIQSLSNRYRFKLTVVGRSDETQVENVLQELREKVESITYVQCDFSDREQAHGCVEKIKENHDSVDYLINSAGVQISSPFVTKSSEEIDIELQSKISVVQNIVEMSKILPLKNILNFSSVVAHFGNTGQTIYAFGNAYIEHLVARAGVPYTNIRWPPWDGVGMMKDKWIMLKMQERGISMLTKAEAGTFFVKEFVKCSNATVMYHDHMDVIPYNKEIIQKASNSIIGDASIVNGQPIFSKLFSLQEQPYLRSHEVMSKIYVPAATIVADIIAQAQILGLGMISVKNFVAHNPIIVNKEITVQYIYADNKVTVRSTVVHFTCDIVRTPSKRSKKEKPATTSVTDFKIYSKETLFHENDFRMLSGLLISENGSIHSNMNLSSKCLAGSEGYDNLTLLIDGCFQVLAINYFNKFNKMCLPVSFEQFDFENIDALDLKGLGVFMNNLSIDENGITGDAQITNCRDDLIVDIKGMCMRAL